MRLEKLPKQKPKHRKGLWSPEEDEKLGNYVLRHGHGCWSSVSNEIGLQRNGKSCRLRWINYLRPGLKRGKFSKNEEEVIFSSHRDLGNKWSQIAQKLPGRTDNEIKNHWHTHMKKRSSRTAKTATTESQGLSSRSTNNGSFHASQAASSTDTNQTLVSGSNNGFSKEGLKVSMPKVIFEEWLYSTKLNPFDDQVTNVFARDAFMDDNNDQLFLLDEGSLDFESGGGWASDVIALPDYLGYADHPICSDFNHAPNDVMYPWNL